MQLSYFLRLIMKNNEIVKFRTFMIDEVTDFIVTLSSLTLKLNLSSLRCFW